VAVLFPFGTQIQRIYGTNPRERGPFPANSLGSGPSTRSGRAPPRGRLRARKKSRRSSSPAWPAFDANNFFGRSTENENACPASSKRVEPSCSCARAQPAQLASARIAVRTCSDNRGWRLLRRPQESDRHRTAQLAADAIMCRMGATGPSGPGQPPPTKESRKKSATTRRSALP